MNGERGYCSAGTSITHELYSLEDDVFYTVRRREVASFESSCGDAGYSFYAGEEESETRCSDMSDSSGAMRAGT